MLESAPRGIAINSEAAFRNQQLDFLKTMRIEDIRDFGFPDGIADDWRLIAAEDYLLQMRTSGNDATHYMKAGIREHQTFQHLMMGKGFLLYLIHLIGHALIIHRLGNLDAGILLVDSLHRNNTASPGSTQELPALNWVTTS